jgi:Flp pilus assembly protein TadG
MTDFRESPMSNRHARRRTGAAVAEFAFVAPVFFLMIIGFVEFGRALMVQQVIVNASRVGARQATMPGATTSEVSTAVQDYASSVSVSPVTVSVTPDPFSAASGSQITVTTSVDFSQVSWLAPPWFLGGRTLTAASTMRKEGIE